MDHVSLHGLKIYYEFCCGIFTSCFDSSMDTVLSSRCGYVNSTAGRRRVRVLSRLTVIDWIFWFMNVTPWPSAILVCVPLLKWVHVVCYSVSPSRGVGCLWESSDHQRIWTVDMSFHSFMDHCIERVSVEQLKSIRTAVCADNCMMCCNIWTVDNTYFCADVISRSIWNEKRPCLKLLQRNY